mgnify:CR=1 FL=1
MVKRYGLLIEYDGADFYGWQRQQEFRTVQGEIETALSRMAKEPIELHGSGRTDKGVHAGGQFAHFDWTVPIPAQDLTRALNAKLPRDIVILDAKEMPSDFHSRYDCKGKVYRYRFYTEKIPRARQSRYALRVGWDLDQEKMARAAKSFIGTYDFKGFTSARCDKEITVRSVYHASIHRNGNDWEFITAGSGYLYNMVRVMVGTLIDIGRGRLEEDVIQQILETQDRTLGGKTVTPEGLSLEKVFYSAEEREAWTRSNSID